MRRALFIFLFCFVFENAKPVTLLAKTSTQFVKLELDLQDSSNSTSTALGFRINQYSNIIFAANSIDNTAYFLNDRTLFSVDLQSLEFNKIWKMDNIYEIFAMDIDFLNDNVYMSKQSLRYNHGRIDACSLKNISFCTTILSNQVDGLRSLILDPKTGNMFWQSGVTKILEMSTMAGENRTLVDVKVSQQSHIRSVFYDSSRKSIFFIKRTGPTQMIMSCSIDGSGRCQEIVELFDVINFVVSGSHLIWTAGRNETIFHCEFENCQAKIVKTSLQGYEMFIIVNQDTKESMKNLDSCSQFSLISGNTTKCACETGHELISPNDCRDNIRKIMYISSLNGVLQMSLDTPQLVVTPVKKTANITEGIEFDTATGTLYWIENDGESKYLKTFDGKMLELPVTVSKIRLHPTTNHLFWLDNQSRIGVTSLTTKFSKTLIFPLKNAKSFAIDENDQTILIAMDHQIRKFSMQGQQKRVVYTSEKRNSISDLNIRNDTMIWIESDSNEIKMMNLFTQKTTTVDVSLPDDIAQPRSIDILENQIFISFLIGKTIVKYSLATMHLEKIDAPSFGAVSIKVVTLDEIPDASKIYHNTCHHITLPVNPVRSMCECADGYFMNEETSECVGTKNLAFVLDSDELLSFSPIDEKELTPKMLIFNYFEHFKTIKSLDIDSIRRYLVIGGESHYNTGIIAKVQIPNISKAEVIESIQKMTILAEDASIIGIFEIAVDYVTGNIYWTNEISDQIEVMGSDGKFRRILAWERGMPRNIVVNAELNILFYYDAAKDTAIRSMSMNGEHHAGFVEHVSSLTSLALTSNTNLIYSTNNSKSWILTSTSIGGYSQEILYAGHEWRPVTMFIHYEMVYVMEENGRFGVYNGDRFTEIGSYPKTVKLMKVFEQNQQLSLREKGNACFENKSKCDQLCIAESCTCQTHFIIKDTKCVPDSNQIFAVKPDGFYSLRIDKNSNYDVVVKLFIAIQSPVVDFSIHSIDRIIFWIEENELSAIKCAQIDDPMRTVHSITARATSICNKYHSLAVDSIGHQLYVTCYRDNVGYVIAYRVSMSNYVKLKFIAIIVSGGAYESATGFPVQPKDIVIFPKQNLFYYVDGTTHIIQCTLDGKKCSIWLRINSPTKLQKYGSQLFYINSSGVWSRNILSLDTRLLHNTGKTIDIVPVNDKTHLIASGPRVFDIPNDYTLKRLNGTTHFQRQESYELSTDACHDSKCSHICSHSYDNKFAQPKCLCPLGMEISSLNEFQCVPTIECLLWQFTCANGKQCIHSGKKCDGVNDCDDHSDESFDICRYSTTDFWPCDDGYMSVNRTLLCDGFSNCQDSSDELHCRCERPYEFFDCAAWKHSTSSKCINRQKVCDRNDDCGNNEDENHTICQYFESVPTKEIKWIYFLLIAMLICIIAMFLIGLFFLLKERFEKPPQRILPVSMMPTSTSITSEGLTPVLVVPWPEPEPVSKLLRKNSTWGVNLRKRQSLKHDEFPRSSTPYENEHGSLPSIPMTPIFRDI